jgi:condensin complex subunit 1
MESCQNASLKPAQKKQLKEHLCHIVGIMIKKYNHSYGACVTILQTLPHYEHFSAIYADLIQTCVLQLGYESILSDLLREFRHTNMSPGGGGGGSGGAANQAAKENPNTKYYAQFLVEITDRLAVQLLPYLSLIQDFLDDESYLMRNAVLYAYGEIVVKCLHRDATANDLKLKQMRNELLDTLIEHIHDCNGLVRSKTLQIWRRICEENAVPLNYTGELMRRVIGRMEDVASSVRKSAFQLLCDLIRNNPFGIKAVDTSAEQIEAELAKEELILNSLNEENDKLIEEINEIVKKSSGKQPKKKPSRAEGANEDDDEEMPSEEDEEAEEPAALQDTTMTEATVPAVNDVELEARRQRHEQLVVIQKSKVSYLRDTLSFVNQIQEAIPKLSKLLFSKTQTDVLEVIGFFVTCYEHGFTDMLTGVRKMLSLMLSAEKTIKDAVVSAYKRLYLSKELSSLQIAKQLMRLVQGLSVCERLALEELIGEFASSNQLDNSVIQILWEIFVSVDQQSAANRLDALTILGMVIKKIPSKGRANVQYLIEYGLSLPPEGQTASDCDYLRISETCLALSYITPDTSSKQLTQVDVSKPSNNKEAKGKGGRRGLAAALDESAAQDTADIASAQQPKLIFNSEPYKLPNNHSLFERISDIILSQFENFKSVYWSPMVENMLHCIFKLADNPVQIVESIVNKLLERMVVFKIFTCQSRLPPVPLFNQDTSTMTATAMIDIELVTPISDTYSCSAAYMSRFFTLLGLVATKLLVFLNQFVVCELKRRKMCKETRSNLISEAKAKEKSSKAKRKSFASKTAAKSSLVGSSGDAYLEEEMGLQGAEAEDVELLFAESVLDQKVAVGCRSQIAQLLPSIIFILKDPELFNSEHLQLSCAMALVRIMLLSKRIAEENIRLLFTLMEKSTNSDLRAQLIIGIGDLVYRFPNTLEPWTNNLYLPLRDTKSNEVRMNTIRVLSHLILKELIKTRGQIYEIALCTIDPEQRISSLAKLFFQELSQRNNGLVIYNAMPDIISQLSDGGEAVTASQATAKLSSVATADHLAAREITEESFRTVVTYLFTFIKKDKQCETLIEKLCTGFRMANTSERKCRDLVFCLSRIQLSESGIKKLKENFKFYADKLTIPVVYDTFKGTILKNARKLPQLKPETKLVLDELEKEMDDVRQKGLQEQ